MPEPRLVVFADYVCPYCYLAEFGVARLRQDGLLAVHGAAFELRPAGTPLPAPDAAWPGDDWQRQVEPLAAELDVVLNYPPLVTRSRKAHEAAAYARSEGVWEAMHGAIYRAYWQDGRDIGRIDVLTAIGEDVGLDRTSIRIALDIDQWTEPVLRAQQAARRLQLDAVPAYVVTSDAEADAEMNGAAEVRLGTLRYEELRAWVETHL